MYDPVEACNENDESKGDDTATEEKTTEENEDVEMAEEEAKEEVKEEPKSTSTPVRQTKAKRGRK